MYNYFSSERCSNYQQLKVYSGYILSYTVLQMKSKCIRN